jgi:hypothetical protein
MALLRIMYLKSLEATTQLPGKPENIKIIKELSNVNIINWKEEDNVSHKHSNFEEVSSKIAK